MRGREWTPESLINFVDRIADHHDAGRLPFALHLAGGNEEHLIDIFSEIQEGDCSVNSSKHVPCPSSRTPAR